MENRGIKQKGLLRLDLGCGNNKKEGFEGVDITKEGTQADFACDLFNHEWLWDNGAVDELYCNQVFEHVPAKGRVHFMEEAWRVLKVGGIFTLITPYAWSRRSIQDFTHEWPPIVPESYLYFNRKWREINGLLHAAYDIACDFELTNCQMARMEKKEFGDNIFAMEHYINVVDDMIMTLTKL